MRLRLLALAAVAALPAAALAGCGGDGDDGLATLAKPGTVVFVEGTIRPSGELKTNVDRLAKRIGGIDNLGDFIVEKAEQETREEGEPFDYETEVEPWLGETAAVAVERVEKDGDLSDPLIVLESTDADATQEFIDRQARTSKEPYRDGSYEGVEYKVGGDDDDAVGLIGDELVLAEDEAAFRAAVDTSQGDSLADEDRYDEAISAATEGSLADVYVDVGTVLRQSGDRIDPQILSLLGVASAGFDPDELTLVASILPGEDQIEVDLSSDLGDGEAPSGDPSELLGSLPAGSFAAIGVSGFGEQLQEAVDSIDESGIPDQVPPGALKGQLKAIGLDLDKFVGSLGDAAIFVEGRDEGSLGGALVLTTDDPRQAAETVASIGRLLRSTGTPGVTAVTGPATGFSIRDKEELGDKPVVIVTKGQRIAIGYGLRPTLAGVTGTGATLSDTPAYQEAVSALGDTSISGFVAGPAALRLADSMISPSDTDFEEAKPYLRSISSIALGSASEDDRVTARLIISVR
ncbi:MAG TPA: DUF3352 domain-containing protein [Solirubrobacterales bacterium]